MGPIPFYRSNIDTHGPSSTHDKRKVSDDRKHLPSRLSIRWPLLGRWRSLHRPWAPEESIVPLEVGAGIARREFRRPQPGGPPSPRNRCAARATRYRADRATARRSRISGRRLAPAKDRVRSRQLALPWQRGGPPRARGNRARPYID